VAPTAPDASAGKCCAVTPVVRGDPRAPSRKETPHYPLLYRAIVIGRQDYANTELPAIVIGHLCRLCQRFRKVRYMALNPRARTGGRAGGRASAYDVTFF
jgi:hypothetical protein